MEWPTFISYSFQIELVNESWEETAKLFWEIQPKIKNVIDIGYSEFIFKFDDRKHFNAALELMDEHKIQIRIY